jgi:hypothetical protein
MLTPPEHMSLPPVFNGVRVSQSLVLCVCFVDRYLSFCTVSFGHCAFLIIPLVINNMPWVYMDLSKLMCKLKLICHVFSVRDINFDSFHDFPVWC